MGPLEIIRVIAGFVLVLFVPGFALSWALFPRRESLSDIERLAYSFVLSLLSVMLGVLFMDVKLGLEVTTVNILIVIGLIVAGSAILYAIEIIAIRNDLLRKWYRRLGSIPESPKIKRIRERIPRRIPFIRSREQEGDKKV